MALTGQQESRRAARHHHLGGGSSNESTLLDSAAMVATTSSRVPAHAKSTMETALAGSGEPARGAREAVLVLHPRPMARAANSSGTVDKHASMLGLPSRFIVSSFDRMSAVPWNVRNRPNPELHPSSPMSRCWFRCVFGRSLCDALEDLGWIARVALTEHVAVGRQQRDDGGVFHHRLVRVPDDAGARGVEGRVLGHDARVLHHDELDHPQHEEDHQRQDDDRLDERLARLANAATAMRSLR